MNGPPAPQFSAYVATDDWVAAVGFTVTAYALVYQLSNLPDAWRRWLVTPRRYPGLWLVTVLGVNLAPLLVATVGFARHWSPETSKLISAPVTLLSAACGTWLLLSRLTLDKATTVTVDGVRGATLSDEKRGEETADLLVLVVTSILKEKDPGTIRRQATEAIRWVHKEASQCDEKRLGEVVKRCLAVLGSELVNGARPSMAHVAAYLSVVIALHTASHEKAARWGFDRLWRLLDSANRHAHADSAEPGDPAFDAAWDDLIRTHREFKTPGDFEALEEWTVARIRPKFPDENDAWRDERRFVDEEEE